MKKTQLNFQNKTRICKLRVRHKINAVPTRRVEYTVYANRLSRSDSGIKRKNRISQCPAFKIKKNFAEVKEVP